MELFIKIAQFICIISILVGLHELGHFIPAKIFKTKVEKFYLFFDVKFSLFKKKIGETVYGIGWLPLGGYVKIAGMIDESMDTEQMKQPPQPWEFRSKPAWQRLIIMVGGVTVNVLLAWVIYSAMLVANGDTYIPSENLKYGIVADEVGEAIGFQTGDRVLEVDGKAMKQFDKVPMRVILGDEVTVSRNGERVTFPITDEGKKVLFERESPQFISARSLPIIGFVAKETLAEEIGLEVGDKFVSLNGQEVTYWDEFRNRLQTMKGKDIAITIERDGRIINKETKLNEDGRLGIAVDQSDLRVTDEYGFLAAIPEGLNKTFRVLSDQVLQFKVIFNAKTGAYKKVEGPIGIVNRMPSTWDWGFFWSFTAMFSVWLAFVNILPIPALDGGHVMFLLYEMITGRKPSQKVLEAGQIVGFIFVAGLMLLIFGNDIWNLFKK